MKNNKKTFGELTLTYGLGYLFVRGISFLLLPLYTNLLSPSETGFIFLFLTLLAFLNTFYNHGMDSSLLKFYTKKDSKEIITTSICYSVLFGLLLSVIIIILKNQILLLFIQPTLPNNLIYYLVLILFFDMLISRTKNIIRLLEKPYYYLIISLLNVLASLMFNIYFINTLQMGVEGALISLVIVSFIQFLLITPIIIKFFNLSYFHKDLLYKMLSFSLPFLPAAMFFIIIEMSDRWMIEWLGNMHEVGLYGSGYKIGSIVLMIVLAFNLNWQPFYLKKQEPIPIKKIENIGNLFISILLIITWVISFGAPVILSFNWGLLFPSIDWFSIIGKNFWDGLIVIPAICLSYVFYGIFIIQMPAIFLKNKQKWIPVFWGTGALINITLNYFLIQRFGFLGAALSTMLTYFLIANFIIYKNKSWMPIRLNYRRLVPFCIIVIIAAQYNLNLWSENFSMQINLLWGSLNFICLLLSSLNINYMFKKYHEK